MNPIQAFPGVVLLNGGAKPVDDEQRAKAFVDDLAKLLFRHDATFRGVLGPTHCGFDLKLNGKQVLRLDVGKDGEANISVESDDD